MPLELTHPHGLWLLSLLVPLLLLYALKVRRTKAVVSSLLLWRAATRELSAQRPFRKLAPRVSLFLQGAFLLLVAFALSGPTQRSTRFSADHLGVVLDLSGSMQTRAPDQATRFDSAKRKLLSLVEALPPASDAFIVTAGAQAMAIGPPLRDKLRLASLVNGLVVEDTEPDLQAAIGLASERLRRMAGSRRLVIITDHSLSTDDLELPEMATSVLKVGSPEPNSAVDILDIRRVNSTSGASGRVEVLVRVSQYASRRLLYVTLRQANSTAALDSRQLQLGPGDKTTALLSFVPAATDDDTALTVEVSPDDALPLDDRAFARIPRSENLTVFLLSKEPSPWLERALLADEHVDLYRDEGSLAAHDIPRDALLFSVGHCPARPSPGDLVVIDPGSGPCLGVSIGEQVESPVITSFAVTDSRLRFVAFDGVALAAARPITLGRASESLVRSDRGTIVADASGPASNVTILSFDPNTSNWPLRASFVVFVRNLLELARNQRPSTNSRGHRVGQSIRMRVPLDVEDVEWTRPDGTTASVIARGGMLVLPPLKKAGHHFLSWKGSRPGGIGLPVNLAGSSESRPATMATKAPSEQARRNREPETSTAVNDAALIDLSPWLAAAAFAVLLADIWWSTRRRLKLVKARAARWGGSSRQ